MSPAVQKLDEKVLKALGGIVPPSFRDRFAEWRQNGGELFIPYDIIRHPGFYAWVIDDPDVDFHDGTEGITVWVCNFGRLGHASSAS